MEVAQDATAGRRFFGGQSSSDGQGDVISEMRRGFFEYVGPGFRSRRPLKVFGQSQATVG
jgi:hypothetical protein